MRRVYLLIGNIASGKSTWRKSHTEHFVVSRDDIRYTLCPGKYTFDRELEKAVAAMADAQLEAMLKYGDKDIVIDETNMSKKVRKRTLRLVEKYNAEAIAVCFPDKGRDEHVRRRLRDNHGDLSEVTWNGVYDGLVSAFEFPEWSEGFLEIRCIKTKEK